MTDVDIAAEIESQMYSGDFAVRLKIGQWVKVIAALHRGFEKLLDKKEKV